MEVVPGHLIDERDSNFCDVCYHGSRLNSVNYTYVNEERPDK